MLNTEKEGKQFANKYPREALSCQKFNTEIFLFNSFLILEISFLLSLVFSHKFEIIFHPKSF